MPISKRVGTLYFIVSSITIQPIRPIRMMLINRAFLNQGPLENKFFRQVLKRWRKIRNAEIKQKTETKRWKGLNKNKDPQSASVPRILFTFGKAFSEVNKSPQAANNEKRYFNNKSHPPSFHFIKKRDRICSYSRFATLKLSVMSSQFCGKGKPNFQ